MKDFLTALRGANLERQRLWVADGQPDVPHLFRALETIGECGEVANVVKKIEREERGWRGSRATWEDLSDEIGDVVICLDLLAHGLGYDLSACWSNPAAAAMGHRMEQVVRLARNVSALANLVAMDTRVGLDMPSLFADSLTAAEMLARIHGLKLDDCVARKFNKTSAKQGFPVYIFDDGD